MPARLAQLAIASLLAGALRVQAADNEAAVKLTGIAHFNNRSRALLEIQPQPGRPVIKPVLAEGERVEGVEVKEIDAKSGRVRVIHNGVETFYLVGSGESAAVGPTLQFKSAELAQVLEIYQELSGRAVLRPASLPGTRISIRTQTELTHAEVVQALENILSANGITTRRRDEKFIFVVPTNQVGRLSFIPDPPADLPGGENPGGGNFPPGLIKFQDTDVSQVLEICQELRGRTLLKPSNLPYVKISVRSQTEMTRDQAIWMLDAVLALADIGIVPQGEKFFFALAGIENPRAPVFEPNTVSPGVKAQEMFPAGLIKFQSADLSQVLPVYAELLGRKPLPVDRTTPAVKLDLRTQTELTRAEAVFALDALAAVNNLKFVLVGDDQVKILPAALARRETNPAQ
jgi:type II secretory pathway component GspD/PulD (secretin)